MSDTQTSAALPSTVNSQITDAITQTNVKVLGDAPAIAMGNLFLATSQALSNAAYNATNSQQQAYITMQASTTMGVTTLYSIDTASTGVATNQVLAKTEAAAEPQLDPAALQAKLNSAVEDLKAAHQHPSLNAVLPDRLVEMSHAFAEAVRDTMAAFSAALHMVGDSFYAQNLHIIQLAATTACLDAMIKSPEQVKSYEHILELIKELGD